MRYYVTLLESPGSVDFGGSESESTAARMALRVANRERTGTCVVRAKDGEIVQRVFWKGLAVAEQQPDEHEPRYLSFVKPGDDALTEFITRFTGEGRTVTISPCHSDPSLVNAVASK